MADKKDTDAPAEPTVEDLSRQIEALRADLAGIAETLKALGLSQGKAAADEVRSRAEKARDAGEQHVEEMRARLDEMIAEADRMARAKPVTAMGIVAGFGFLLGLLLGRR